MSVQCCWRLCTLLYSVSYKWLPVATRFTGLRLSWPSLSMSHLWFYHLRQMRAVRKSLTTIVHALIASRLDHCNGVLYRLSAANLPALQSVLNAGARNTTTSHLHYATIYTHGCLFVSEYCTSCTPLFTSVLILSDEFMCSSCYQYKSSLSSLSNTWRPAGA